MEKIKTKVKRITTTLLSEILEHNLTPYIYYILTRQNKAGFDIVLLLPIYNSGANDRVACRRKFFFREITSRTPSFYHQCSIPPLLPPRPGPAGLKSPPLPPSFPIHPEQLHTHYKYVPTYYSTLVYCTVDQYFSCCYGFPQFQGNYVGTPYGLLTQLGRPSARYFPASPKIVDDTLYQQRDSFVSCRVKKFGVSLLTAMSFKSCIYLNVQYSTYKPFQNCPLGCDLYGLG